MPVPRADARSPSDRVVPAAVFTRYSDDVTRHHQLLRYPSGNTTDAECAVVRVTRTQGLYSVSDLKHGETSS